MISKGYGLATVVAAAALAISTNFLIPGNASASTDSGLPSSVMETGHYQAGFHQGNSMQILSPEDDIKPGCYGMHAPDPDEYPYYDTTFYGDDACQQCFDAAVDLGASIPAYCQQMDDNGTIAQLWYGKHLGVSIVG